MGTNSWLVLVGILLIFIIVAIAEVRIENGNYYYHCYHQSIYKYRAEDYKCKGIENAEKCKDCPYHKKYLRSLKHENN